HYLRARVFEVSIKAAASLSSLESVRDRGRRWGGLPFTREMPQLSGGGGGDPELCATDEMIPFKDEGDPQKEQIFAEISHSEEEGDLAEIKSSLVNETEISPDSNSHDAARQSQMTPDPYLEKHRDHPDEGKLQDLYSKGHSYPSYPGYIMMTNMNNEPYMNNGSLSPPMPRTVSADTQTSLLIFHNFILPSLVVSCIGVMTLAVRDKFGDPYLSTFFAWQLNW
ncbi:hypothetical protein DNTS_012340, partial [Danionella cerebrum]